MWERAYGIPPRDCAISHGAFSSRGVARIQLGAPWETLLRRAGQPQQRTRTWAWCVQGNHNQHAADVAVLTDAGRVELVGSTARGHSAGGIAVGSAARGLRSGITVRRVGRATRFYVVRRGRVYALGVMTRSLSRRAHALRVAVARVLAAQATQGPPGFVPSPALAAALRSGPTGRTLAGSTDPVLNAKFAFLCRVNMQGT
jgi:hypothetical protein